MRWSTSARQLDAELAAMHLPTAASSQSTHTQLHSPTAAIAALCIQPRGQGVPEAERSVAAWRARGGHGQAWPAACKRVLLGPLSCSINERLIAVAHPHDRSRRRSHHRRSRRRHHHSRCRWRAHGRERQQTVSSPASTKQQAMLLVHTQGQSWPHTLHQHCGATLHTCRLKLLPKMAHTGSGGRRREAPSVRGAARRRACRARSRSGAPLASQRCGGHPAAGQIREQCSVALSGARHCSQATARLANGTRTSGRLGGWVLAVAGHARLTAAGSTSHSRGRLCCRRVLSPCRQHPPRCCAGGRWLRPGHACRQT